MEYIVHGLVSAVDTFFSRLAWDSVLEEKQRNVSLNPQGESEGEQKDEHVFGDRILL